MPSFCDINVPNPDGFCVALPKTLGLETPIMAKGDGADAREAKPD